MTVKELKLEIQDIWDEVEYDIEKCTCNQCYPDPDMIVRCQCAFDLYNIGGECLMTK